MMTDEQAVTIAAAVLYAVEFKGMFFDNPAAENWDAEERLHDAVDDALVLLRRAQKIG